MTWKRNDWEPLFNTKMFISHHPLQSAVRGIGGSIRSEKNARYTLTGIPLETVHVYVRLKTCVC